MSRYIVALHIAGTSEYAAIVQTKHCALTLSHADCVRPCPLPPSAGTAAMSNNAAPNGIRLKSNQSHQRFRLELYSHYALGNF